MLHEQDRFTDPHMESLLPAQRSNRRGFIAAGSLAGFALATGPVNAQTVIRTGAEGLDVNEVRVPVSGGQMPAYMAAPAKSGKYAVVIVIPEVFGVHEYQKDLCRRLAKAGYLGISADPFFRMGDLSKMTNIGEVVAAANKLEDAQMLGDLDSLVAFIEKQPKANANKIGVTGMCRGGRSTWMFAGHSKKVAAAVSWYGHMTPTPPAMPRTPFDVVSTLSGPVLGLYGGADGGIPVQHIARMQEALKAGNKSAKASHFILYPDMPHGFHSDYRPTYRKEAAEAGWKEMLAWFKQHGVA